MLRLGLCCAFYQEPILFRTATAAVIKKFRTSEQLQRLSALCLQNAQSLSAAIQYCALHHIGSFRVNSGILPLKTHPQIGYTVTALPHWRAIRHTFLQCRTAAQRLNIRLTFHPDQFVLLSSPRPEVIEQSIAELEYQAQVSELIGADVITLHGGGAYGDKPSALKRMAGIVAQLDKRIRLRLAFENDDRVYTPSDLLPFCRDYGIPFVYDVHHHRCLPDTLSVKQATMRALKTWNREPLFHLSSPRNSWESKQPRWHDDYIDVNDFPVEWRKLNITVEVEAKAKELAVQRLYQQLVVEERGE